MNTKEDMWFVALAILECPYTLEEKKNILSNKLKNYVPTSLITTGLEPFDKAIELKIKKQQENK